MHSLQLFIHESLTPSVELILTNSEEEKQHAPKSTVGNTPSNELLSQYLLDRCVMTAYCLKNSPASRHFATAYQAPLPSSRAVLNDSLQAWHDY